MFYKLYTQFKPFGYKLAWVRLYWKPREGRD